MFLNWVESGILKIFGKSLFIICSFLNCFPAIALSLEVPSCNDKTEECFNENTNYARQLIMSGKFLEAEDAYKSAFSLGLDTNNDLVAEAKANRSWNYQKLGRYIEAEELNQEVIDYFEAPEKYVASGKALSSLYNNHGLIYRATGRATEAIDYFKDSIESSFDDPEKLIKNNPDLSTVTILWNTGAQHVLIYRYNEAEKYLDQALLIADKLGLNNADVAKIYALKARLSFKKGEQAQAKDWLNKAFEVINKQNEDVRAAKAGILIEAAEIQNPEQEENFLKEAIDLYLDVYPNKNESRKNAYMAYGDFLNSQKRFEEANIQLEIAHENAKVFPAYESDWTQAQLPASRAKNLCALERFNEGLVLIDKSISTLREELKKDSSFNRTPTWEKLAGFLEIKATCLEKNGTNFSALEIQRQASNIYQNILNSRNNLDPNYQLNKRMEYKNSFVKHIELISSIGFINEESYFKESLKISQLAQTSLASLAIKERVARSDDPKIKKVEEQYQIRLKDLERVNKELETLKANVKSDQGEINRLIERRKNIEKGIKISERRLRKESPGYIEYLTTKPVTLKNVQENLKKGQALISFIQSEQKLLAWGISENNYYYYSTANLEDLIKHINTLRNAIELPIKTGVAPKNLDNFPFSSSHSLYLELLNPFFNQFLNIEDLLIIPDGRLHSIPFAALLSEYIQNNLEPKWLIKEVAIGIIPSFETIASLKDTTDFDLDEIRFIGFGNPLIGQGLISKNDFKRRGFVEEFNQVIELPALPQTQRELELISSNFKSSNINLFLGEDATEETLKQIDLKKFNIVAFATHAISTKINSNLIEPSLILTPVSQADSKNDGILTASDINRLKFNADLVILSACETANTSLQSNQAYAGLAESFFFAGSKAILATHWEVETNSAVEITTGLIRNLGQKGNLTYSQALRKSVLDLIQDNEKYKHPLFWAPYIIIGNKK